MNKVIKIILSILGALFVFLAGWFCHAWKNRREVTKEVKKTIIELNREHKKALKALKDRNEHKQRAKDEIINNLYKIIDRLLNLFESKTDLSNGNVNKVVNNLKRNKEKLNQLN